jgi:hypothetical protein
LKWRNLTPPGGTAATEGGQPGRESGMLLARYAGTRCSHHEATLVGYTDMSKASWIPGSGTPPATNLNVALAVARQRLGDAHFQFALELIRRGQGEVAAPQALSIYSRLHDLAEIDHQALRNRVLIYLGQMANTDVTHLPHTFVAIDGGVEWDITASLVERIRKRLGGRKNHTFREWVELHSGHVESKLLRIHIENLAGLYDATDGSVKLPEVTRLYMREIGLPDAIFEPLHAGLLERMYEQIDADLGDSDDEVPAAEDAEGPDPNSDSVDKSSVA